MGYKEVPTETVWTRHVALALRAAGVTTIVNSMGSRGNGTADRTLVTRYGVYLIEFKGPSTVATENQKLFIEKVNRSATAGGDDSSTLVAAILRYPNLLESPRGEVSTPLPCPLLAPALFTAQLAGAMRKLATTARYYFTGGSLGHD